MASIVVRAAHLTATAQPVSFKDSAAISGWARADMATAVADGLISGYPDNTAKPQANATRAEAAALIIKALQIKP